MLVVNRKEKNIKPLDKIDEFLKRFNHFKNGEFRSIEVISPTIMQISLAGQDENRAFDWMSITLEFNSITNAQLLENKKLALLDMNDGISIIKTPDGIAFGLGHCSTLSRIQTASCYIESSTLKYKEGSF